MLIFPHLVIIVVPVFAISREGCRRAKKIRSSTASKSLGNVEIEVPLNPPTHHQDPGE
jgi:hypothetical protein